MVVLLWVSLAKPQPLLGWVSLGCFSRMLGRQTPPLAHVLLVLSVCASLGLHISLDTDASKNSPLAQGAQGAPGDQAPPCLLQWHCRHHLFLPGDGK